MIQNLLLDWSGTLSDDLVPVYTASMKVLRRLGIGALSLDEFRREFELPYMRYYHKFKPDANKLQVDRLFAEEFEKVEKPRPFAWTKQMLEYLFQRNFQMLVLSSHGKKVLQREAIEYGFQHYFVDLYGGVHDKTQAIFKVMKRNHFLPERTAFVGDMSHDIDAGKKAGVKTIAVLWGYATREQLMQSRPDFIVGNLSEFKTVLQ
jgi:phosphoglycolate phosphatase